MSSFVRPFTFLAAAGRIAGVAFSSQFTPAPNSPAPSGQAPQPAPGQDQAASQEPTLKINVDLVNILFTVKAKKGGQLIPNLEQNNFKIYEDGKEQKIQRFS